MIISALIINVFITFAVANSDLCPELYKRYSSHHTYCLPPHPTCKIITTGVSKDDIEEILREHNILRSKVATGKETIGPLPTAANMVQLEWHDELAEVAQKHAEQCVMEHDCNSCREIRDFNVGQNLYEYLSNSPEPLKPNWTLAIHEWYAEVKFFKLDILHHFGVSKPHEEYGHFTQLIWGPTARVGCGYALFKDGQYQHELYTCNYGPDGNILKEPVYKAGVPCTLCPDYFSCNLAFNTFWGPKYPGLCRYTGRKSLIKSIEDNHLFNCDFQDPATCITETIGEWIPTHTLSGSYMSTVLEGGESSVLNFTTPFQAKHEMCISLYYRKGPNHDGDKAANVAYELLYNLETGEVVKVELPGNPNTFTKFDLSFTSPYRTKFSLSFSVPPSVPKQYFEFKDIEVNEGTCGKL